MDTVERQGKLYTIRELREQVGEDVLGKHAAYALARVYGFRLGRKYLVPGWVVENLFAGKLDVEEVAREARKRRGRA